MRIFPSFALVVLLFCLATGIKDEQSEWQSDATVKPERPERVVQKNPVKPNLRPQAHQASSSPNKNNDRPSTQCATTRKACSNFNAEVETALNLQIKEELTASYVYLTMSHHFDRDDIALRGFSKKFSKMSDEEREHAQKLMTYMNKRGGQITLAEIPKPTRQEWDTGLQAIQDSLNLEHVVNAKLLDVHWIAQRHNDVHLQDFLEGEFLTEQVDSIKQLSDYVTVLERLKEGGSVGEFLFDQQLLEEKR